MQAKNISDAELANRVGVKGPSSISHYRSGRQFPSNPDRLIKLANALGVSVDRLIGNGKYSLRSGYGTENDLLFFADTLSLSPVTIANLQRLSGGSKPCIDGIDALLSSTHIADLADSISEVLAKCDRANRQISQREDAQEKLDEAWKEIIYGKVYVAVRTFEDILEAIINAKLFKSRRSEAEQEADNGTEE